MFEARDSKTGEVGTGSRVDLVFGSNSQSWAQAEVYATGDASETFVTAFVKVSNTVMNADRLDLAEVRAERDAAIS